jgi:HK97 family phage major capsid protein
MLSITEMRDKTESTAKQIKETLDHGHFDYNEVNLWGTGYNQSPEDRLKPAVVKEVWDTIKTAPLREFLAKSGTTDIAGAAYLVPTKIYQIMYDSAVESDVVADISIAVIPAEQIGGTTMNVDIAVDESYQPKKYSSGGAMPTETIETTQATLDFSTPWGINFKITNDLIEDSQFDVIEMHLRNAGREMGEYASNEALGVLKAASDGDGTLNSGVTGNADETKFQGGTTNDVVSAMLGNLTDGFVSDTIVLTHGAALHSVFKTCGASANESELWNSFIMNGWPTQIAGMNIVYSDVDTLTNSKAGDDLVTIVFDKDYALLSGRKRWLRIENYSDPIRDLVGATITARQDSVSIYDDSVFTLTES